MCKTCDVLRGDNVPMPERPLDHIEVFTENNIAVFSTTAGYRAYINGQYFLALMDGGATFDNEVLHFNSLMS